MPYLMITPLHPPSTRNLSSSSSIPSLTPYFTDSQGPNLPYHNPKMKDPLKYLTIAVTGDFGLARTHEKMRQWIECNGGTFAPKFTIDVTHLVCSKEHLRKAVRMGMLVFIPNLLWLENQRGNRLRSSSDMLEPGNTIYNRRVILIGIDQCGRLARLIACILSLSTG